MKITNLEIINFRNYERLSVEFNNNINIFIGNNGEGKTNILEAIYVLAITKSHRAYIDKNLITNNIEILCIPSTIFKIREGSILIFNRDNGELYDVLDGSSRTIENVLLNNGYVIFDKDKKEEDKI